MHQAGVRMIGTVEDLAVVGIFEIISQLPRIRGIFNRIKREVRSLRPQAAVLIDSPDFNLRLARVLKKQRIPVLYYIGPTVWAWRKNRLKTIRKTVNKMMLIFPFEQQIYMENGIPSVFVGHPLLEEIQSPAAREETFRKHGFDPDRPLVVLLPGSRRIEIRHHMPDLIAAAARIKQDAGAQFALLLAENLDPADIRGFVTPEIEPDVSIIADMRQYQEVLAAGDLALSACGTANLEAALLETPLVAFYRVSPLTYSLGKPFVKVDRYSIVNILAGTDVIPELIQGRFTPENLAQEALSLLGSPSRREAMREKFRGIRAALGETKASRRAAEELTGLLAANPPGSPTVKKT
jgi:lipid-A-disaccharide synthase